MLKFWFTITAAIFVSFGLASLLAPHAVTSLYGGETDANGALWARYYGSAIMFAGYIAWFGRGVQSTQVLRFVTLSLLVLVSINLVVSLHAEVRGLMNMLHWTTIGGQVFLMAVWGYYRFGKLSQVEQSEGGGVATPPAAGS